MIHPGIPSEILQSLDETLAQINQMSEMVENLLTLARADEGRAPLAVEETDLREVLGDVAETAGMLGESAGIGVTTDMPAAPVRLAVDRHRVREMLLNLVTNAIKYTPQGGTVSLTLAEEADSVVFTVRDSGIGIAPGDLPHIFERFWRADPARSRTGDRPGTGLGLAITKWIAEAHGGSITVHSRPGRGTIFVVRLPRGESVGPERTGLETMSRRRAEARERYRLRPRPPSRLLIHLSSNCHLWAKGALSSGWYLLRHVNPPLEVSACSKT